MYWILLLIKLGLHSFQSINITDSKFTFHSTMITGIFRNLNIILLQRGCCDMNKRNIKIILKSSLLNTCKTWKEKQNQMIKWQMIIIVVIIIIIFLVQQLCLVELGSIKHAPQYLVTKKDTRNVQLYDIMTCYKCTLRLSARIQQLKTCTEAYTSMTVHNNI